MRKEASADEIIADVRATLQRATAKGGPWRELAEQQLVPVLTLFDGAEAQRAATRAEVEPLLAKLDAETARAQEALIKVADDVWNAVGRPAADPALSILFPGGISYLDSGDVTELPERMEVLVQLLGSGIHPKLSHDKAQAAAADLKGAVAAVRAIVEATRQPLTRLSVLEQVRVAVARTAQVEIAHLKRLYKAAQLSEPDADAILPDRGRLKRVRAQ